MLNLKDVPFFDNHCHPFDVEDLYLTPDRLALTFLHGERDVAPISGVGGWSVSRETLDNLQTLGVVQVMVHRLAKRFGCESEIETVVAARNESVRNMGLQAYVKNLYSDANILATMIDAPEDMLSSHPSLAAFPNRLLRLYQMDPEFERLFDKCPSYMELKESMMHSISSAIRERGFNGIKNHIGENYTLDVRPVYDEEAKAAFARAKSGDFEARKTVYFGVFTEMCLLAQELNTSIHIHTGTTGGYHRGALSDLDPFRMAYFLKNPAFRLTKIVLLHAGYPLMQNAGLMAHAFPHIWVDLGWVLPWISLRFDRCIEDVLAVAPASKLMFGSGQHSIPEIAWLSATVARDALDGLAQRYMDNGSLSRAQFDNIARMMLCENARRLYHL